MTGLASRPCISGPGAFQLVGVEAAAHLLPQGGSPQKRDPWRLVPGDQRGPGASREEHPWVHGCGVGLWGHLCSPRGRPAWRVLARPAADRGGRRLVGSPEVVRTVAWVTALGQQLEAALLAPGHPGPVTGPISFPFSLHSKSWRESGSNRCLNPVENSLGCPLSCLSFVLFVKF